MFFIGGHSCDPTLRAKLRPFRFRLRGAFGREARGYTRKGAITNGKGQPNWSTPGDKDIKRCKNADKTSWR